MGPAVALFVGKVMLSMAVSKIASEVVSNVTGSEELGMVVGMIAGGYAGGALGSASTTAPNTVGAVGGTAGISETFAMEGIGEVLDAGTLPNAASVPMYGTARELMGLGQNGMGTIDLPEPVSTAGTPTLDPMSEFTNTIGEVINGVGDFLGDTFETLTGTGADVTQSDVVNMQGGAKQILDNALGQNAGVDTESWSGKLVNNFLGKNGIGKDIITSAIKGFGAAKQGQDARDWVEDQNAEHTASWAGHDVQGFLDKTGGSALDMRSPAYMQRAQTQAPSRQVSARNAQGTMMHRPKYQSKLFNKDYSQGLLT